MMHRPPEITQVNNTTCDNTQVQQVHQPSVARGGAHPRFSSLIGFD